MSTMWRTTKATSLSDLETGKNVQKYIDLVNVRKESYSISRINWARKNSGSPMERIIFSNLAIDGRRRCLHPGRTGKQFIPGDAYKLSQLILYMARYNNSQIVMATHSPFLLGGVRSKIYNLDERPVRVRKFEELESVRFYHDILCERLNAKN